MKKVNEYFPDLSEQQVARFEALEPLYRTWNEQINVVSRKDIDNIYLHHVLHSMAMAKVVKFVPGTTVIDLGTGGGFPGIPLAILFPEVKFHLIDGTRKKLKVVEAVAEALELENVNVQHVRAEEFKQKADFVVSRAVAKLDKLFAYSERLISNKQKNALPNGLLAFKGGLVKEEIKLLGRGAYTEIYPLKKMYKEEYFEEKSIVYVQW